MASALGAGIVSVVTPLVFPQIPLPVGVGFYAVAGGLFLYAGKDWLRARLPGRWGKSGKPLYINPAGRPDAESNEVALQHYRDSDEGPAELTLSFVRRLSAPPINYKTTQVLRFIASGETPEFRLKDAIAAVDGAKSYLDLRGVWAGLTRRTRSMLDDPNANLIWWREHGVYDEQGAYIDHVGEVSRLTHASLRKHFGAAGPIA